MALPVVPGLSLLPGATAGWGGGPMPGRRWPPPSATAPHRGRRRQRVAPAARARGRRADRVAAGDPAVLPGAAPGGRRPRCARSWRGPGRRARPGPRPGDVEAVLGVPVVGRWRPFDPDVARAVDAGCSCAARLPDGRWPSRPAAVLDELAELVRPVARRREGAAAGAGAAPLLTCVGRRALPRAASAPRRAVRRPGGDRGPGQRPGTVWVEQRVGCQPGRSASTEAAVDHLVERVIAPARAPARPVLAAGRRPAARRVPGPRRRPAGGRRRPVRGHPALRCRRRARRLRPAPDGRLPPGPELLRVGGPRRLEPRSCPAAPAAGKTTLLNALAGEHPAGRADRHHRGRPPSCALGRPTSCGSRRARPTPRGRRGPGPGAGPGRPAAPARPPDRRRGAAGEEAFDLLQAMNTGHSGSLCTFHANGPADALARLESLVLLAGWACRSTPSGPRSTPRVDAVVHVARRPDGPRAVEVDRRMSRSRRPPPACTGRSPTRRRPAERAPATPSCFRSDNGVPMSQAGRSTAPMNASRWDDAATRESRGSPGCARTGGRRAPGGAAPRWRWPTPPVGLTCPRRWRPICAVCVGAGRGDRARSGARRLGRGAPRPGRRRRGLRPPGRGGRRGPGRLGARRPAPPACATGDDAVAEVAALSAQARLSAIVVGAARSSP